MQDIKTIEYYNDNASDYYISTVNVDMGDLYKLFEGFQVPGNHILDLGCGSGRDSKYFVSKGYIVTAIEPSIELAKLASAQTGIEVINKSIQDTFFSSIFDGIWACASLLHIPFSEMPDILDKINKALKPNGVLFISVKKGNSEGYRNGRFFCDYTIDRFEQLNYQDKGFLLLGYHESHDKRAGRDGETWLNVILKKG
jgi:2-polyprenyl-3-methyl-5-hydroxy-6-metoxy-1,4-benzoquinol methylase